MIIAIVLIGVTICAIVVSSLDFPYNDPEYSKVIGEYDMGKLNLHFGNSEAYVIGANSKGMPIFKNRDKAFQQAMIDYKDGFQGIKEEYHLYSANRFYWKKYRVYSWQLTTEDKHIQAEGQTLSVFFDIYENSFA